MQCVLGIAGSVVLSEADDWWGWKDRLEGRVWALLGRWISVGEPLETVGSSGQGLA